MALLRDPIPACASAHLWDLRSPQAGSFLQLPSKSESQVERQQEPGLLCLCGISPSIPTRAAVLVFARACVGALPGVRLRGRPPTPANYLFPVFPLPPYPRPVSHFFLFLSCSLPDAPQERSGVNTFLILSGISITAAGPWGGDTLASLGPAAS